MALTIDDSPRAEQNGDDLVARRQRAVVVPNDGGELCWMTSARSPEYQLAELDAAETGAS